MKEPQSAASVVMFAPWNLKKRSTAMKQEEELKYRFGTRGGMKVPDGYFESFYKEMAEKLPEYPEAPRQAPLSRWQRVKPYVYLAAMFAGIWMMMQVFHRVSQPGVVSLDNPPSLISQAVVDHGMADVYLLPKSVADFEVESEVSESYGSIEEFERDFGYEISDKYDNMSL